MTLRQHRYANRAYHLAAVLMFVALVWQLQSCAATKVAKARQVSVDVHAVLAAVDDAERAFSESPAAGKWNTEAYAQDPQCQPTAPQPGPCRSRHAVFSAYLVKALEAGKALNEGVRAVPVSSQAKADLATVSATLETLTGIVQGTLPPGSTVSVALTAAKDGVLRILPLFLE